MMLRTNLWLLAVAALLAVPTALTLRADRTVFDDELDVPRLLAGFTEGNIWAIRVEVPRIGSDGLATRDGEGRVLRDGVTLERVDVDDPTAWRLGGSDETLAGLPVSYRRVRGDLLEPLAAIRVDGDTLVQQDADVATLARYLLTDDQATVVRCADAQGNVTATLLVGRDASRGQVGEDVVRGYFVRRPESADVVLFERPVWSLSANRDDWIERNPIGLANQDILRVALRNPLTRRNPDLPDGRVALRRGGPSDTEWQAVEHPPRQSAPRHAEVFGFLQTLARFDVLQFVAPLAGADRAELLAQYGLAEPRVELELGRVDGSTVQVLVGDQVVRDGQRQNERYVLVSTTPFVVTAGDWVLAPLERDPLQWFEPPRAR